MSGLREIIEWVKREVILNPENSVNGEYQDISDIFEKDNRSSLDHILRGDKKEFLDFLGSRLSELRAEPKAGKEAETLESRVEAVESSIGELLKGAVNLLGTPIRIIDEQVLPIIREPIEIIEQEIKKTGIIKSIKGFIRGLFS